VKSGRAGADDRLSGQLRLELLDGPNADAMKLRKLDNAYARPEIGDNGRSLVGWSGRTARLRRRLEPARRGIGGRARTTPTSSCAWRRAAEPARARACPARYRRAGEDYSDVILRLAEGG
jgi:hypothetical protein